MYYCYTVWYYVVLQRQPCLQRSTTCTKYVQNIHILDTQDEMDLMETKLQYIGLWGFPKRQAVSTVR